MIPINKLIDDYVEKSYIKETYNWPQAKITKAEVIPSVMMTINKDIPPKYINADVTEEIDEIYNRLRFPRGRGIYFFGPAGTGKTYQMYGLLRRSRLACQDCTFINIPDWLVQLRLRFDSEPNNAGEGAECWIEREIKRKEILFIDDIGVEKVTDWNSEIIYRLINFRSENNLQTYFASNLSLNELAKQRDDRLASRIAGMSVQKEMGGRDRRLGP